MDRLFSIGWQITSLAFLLEKCLKQLIRYKNRSNYRIIRNIDVVFSLFSSPIRPSSVKFSSVTPNFDFALSTTSSVVFPAGRDLGRKKTPRFSHPQCTRENRSVAGYRSRPHGGRQFTPRISFQRHFMALQGSLASKTMFISNSKIQFWRMLDTCTRTHAPKPQLRAHSARDWTCIHEHEHKHDLALCANLYWSESDPPSDRAQNLIRTVSCVYMHTEATRNVGQTRKAKAVVSESRKATCSVQSTHSLCRTDFYLRMKETFWK